MMEDGDGETEIILRRGFPARPVPDHPAHLIVFNKTGQLLHKVILFGHGAMAAPSATDLDKDGELELVTSLRGSLGGTQERA